MTETYHRETVRRLSDLPDDVTALRLDARYSSGKQFRPKFIRESHTTSAYSCYTVVVSGSVIKKDGGNHASQYGDTEWSTHTDPTIPPEIAALLIGPEGLAAWKAETS